ncbi:MAG: metallophosphoesterase [Phycisphaerales bacterium]
MSSSPESPRPTSSSISSPAPTRLGVLSDTHGRAATCRTAVAMLLDAGVDRLIHLGDVGSEAVLEELVADVPSSVVFGNCDDARRLGAYAEHLGLDVTHPIGRLSSHGVDVAWTHGHLPHCVEEAQASADLLFIGHSHCIADEMRGRTRVVNPGALFRAARYTAMIADLKTSRMAWCEVGRPQPR